MKTRLIRIITSFVFLLVCCSTVSAKTGVADTKYSGQQDILCLRNNSSGRYELRGLWHGLGIYTWNILHSTDVNKPISQEFSNFDTNWVFGVWTAIGKSQAALDCQWSAEKTFDYFKNVHNRIGIGGLCTSYVHFGNNHANAYHYYNENTGRHSMFYGDGDGVVYGPFTSLDIVAHEMGHWLLTTKYPNFSKSGESRAINEGFADIWSVCVKNYVNNLNILAVNKNLWLLGSELYLPNNPVGYQYLRNLANPKDSLVDGYPDFKYPDTYQGINWNYSHWPPHINSTILSHWFYILSVGKSGTNDHGYTYNVTGIGIEKAEQIAYRTLMNIKPDTDYFATKDSSIAAAEFLYSSYEVSQVKEAWCAVGVGAATTNYITFQIGNTIDTLYKISVDCNGNPIAPTNYTITYRDKNGKEKCLPESDSLKIHFPLSMPLDSAVWLVNGDTVQTGTDKDSVSFSFPISDWLDENYTDDYIIITVVIPINDSTSIEYNFKFKVSDNAFVAEAAFLLWSELFDFSDLTLEDNTISFGVDLYTEEGLILPIPNILKKCILEIKADSTVSWSLDTSSNSIVFAPTEDCEINCRLKFICECIGILNINIKNTNPACDEEPKNLCDSILPILTQTGEYVETPTGNIAFIPDNPTQNPRTKKEDFLKECNFGLQFPNIPAGATVEVISSANKNDTTTFYDNGVFEVPTLKPPTLLLISKTTETIKSDTLTIIIRDSNGNICEIQTQIFNCICLWRAYELQICPHHSRAVCYCKDNEVMTAPGVPPPDSGIVSVDLELWLYDYMGNKLSMVYFLPAGSNACGNFPLNMFSYSAGFYTLTIEESGLILGTLPFIYDGQNIIGVGSGSTGGSSSSSNSNEEEEE